MKTIRDQFGALAVCLFICTLALAGCSGVAAHIERGDELSNAQMYEEALKEYTQALKLDPENEEIATKVKECKREIAAEENLAGISLMKSGKRFEALASFKKAAMYDPEVASYKKSLHEVADSLVFSGKKAFEEKRFKQAVEILERVLKIMPKHPEANAAMKEAESARAGLLYSQASDYLKRGLYGNALISLVKLKKMVGTHEDSADIEVYTREQIVKAAQYGIKVQAGKARRKWLEPTREIVNRLHAVKLPKCPTAVLPATDDPKLIVSVRLKEIAYNQTSEEESAKQKYQSGTRKVDNPKYLEIEKKIAQSRDRVAQLEVALKEIEGVIEKARETFADAGPDDDDAALRKKLTDAEKKQSDQQKEMADTDQKILELRENLSQTPSKLDEPVYDEYEYEISKITRTATAHVEVKARGEGGSDSAQEDVEGSSSTEDTTNPADAKHSVKADPLEFPKNDEKLGGEAIEKTLDKIKDFIGEQCKQWNEQILDRAQQATSAAPIEAVEDYVLYLLVSSGVPPPGVGEFLKQQTDFTDIKALRGRD